MVLFIKSHVGGGLLKFQPSIQNNTRWKVRLGLGRNIVQVRRLHKRVSNMYVHIQDIQQMLSSKVTHNTYICQQSTPPDFSSELHHLTGAVDMKHTVDLQTHNSLF